MLKRFNLAELELANFEDLLIYRIGFLNGAIYIFKLRARNEILLPSLEEGDPFISDSYIGFFT